MNGFDLAIAVIVLVFAVIGALRGFVREALASLGWVAAGLAAWRLSDSASALMTDLIQDPLSRRIAAFLAVFFAVLLLIAIALLLLRRFLFKGGLTLVDRALGAILGAARGAVVMVIVVLLAGLTPFPKESWWRESRLVGYFQSAAVQLWSVLPLEVARQFSYR